METNFQFHVGDYVKTKDGLIGYVCSFAYRNEYYQIDVKYEGYEKRYFGKLNILFSTFNRIGKYDLTKLQKHNQINPIYIYNPSDFNDIFMATNRNIENIGNKLNELINYINSRGDEFNDD